jgi:hypothetical protein
LKRTKTVLNVPTLWVCPNTAKCQSVNYAGVKCKHYGPHEYTQWCLELMAFAGDCTVCVPYKEGDVEKSKDSGE